MKECPKCEVVNLDTAQRCDSTDSAAKKAIRTVLKAIASVTGVIWFLAPITRYPGPFVFVVSTAVLLACFVGLGPLDHAADMGWWPKKRDPKT